MSTIPSNNPESYSDELLPKYDLDYSKAKPNRFASCIGDQKMKVVLLNDDVAQVFTTPQSVNEALRSLIASKR